MMANGWIFAGVGFVVGLIGGAVGFGSLCTREARAKIDALTEQNDEMAEEIAELKAELRKKKETKAEKKEKEMKSYNEYKKLVEENGYKQKEAENEEEDEDDPFVKPSSPIAPVEDETEEEDWKDKAIYILTDEEFKRDSVTKETEVLTWYKSDKILTDITDDRIRGEAGLIGSEALAKLNDAGFMDKFLYVSNDINDVIYEIENNLTDSYYRDVLGMEA